MTAKKRIAVTGYGPFGSVDINPSAVIVENLASIKFPDIELMTEIIPVAYANADRCSSRLCADVKPDVSKFRLVFGFVS